MNEKPNAALCIQKGKGGDGRCPYEGSRGFYPFETYLVLGFPQVPTN
jgi:hypothetical protein